MTVDGAFGGREPDLDAGWCDPVLPPGLTRRGLLAAGGLVAGLALTRAGMAAGAAQHPHRIRLDAPAGEWLLGLPIGNGRLGAMIGGGVARDVISLNEDTLWTGQPDPDADHDAIAALAEIRQAIFAERYRDADRIARRMQGPFSQSYAPMADLVLDMAHAGPVGDYRRELDLDSAVASVVYRVGEVTFHRKMFASHPDQTIVLRLTADRPGAIDATLSLRTKLRGSVRVVGRRLILTGKAPTNCEPEYRNVPDPVTYSDQPGQGMAFVTAVDAQVRDGAVRADGDALSIRGATEVVVRIAAATGYRGFDRAPDGAVEAIAAAVAAQIDAARNMPVGILLDRHVADHQRLYRRAELMLAPTMDGRPTDRRRRDNAVSPDPGLAALLFNFARYLLIASSRPGTTPANLQGIWNTDLRPPWSCNYTTNINVQMNYWAAETGNLAECHLPLVDFVERLAVAGTRTARTYYGMPGWCVHHNTDIWAMANPVGEGEGDPNWANWPMAAPWLVKHLWEHYRFGGDLTFLRERAYPLMKSCAQFCAAWLVRDPRDGRLTTAPSISPENLFRGPDGTSDAISDGCTMDLALIRELFADCITAAPLLKVDAAWARSLADLTGRLEPYRVGRFGQLQEWSRDFDEPLPDQRHISHLYPLFPAANSRRGARPNLPTRCACRCSAARIVAGRPPVGAGPGPPASGRGWAMPRARVRRSTGSWPSARPTT